MKNSRFFREIARNMGRDLKEFTLLRQNNEKVWQMSTIWEL
jgi:cytidylate kinase